MKDLTLEDLRFAKSALEKVLREAISLEIKRFNAATDWGVHNVHVRMVETTNMSDRRKQFALSRVIVDLEEI